MDEQKQIVRDFLRTQQFAVISTVNEQGSPESALIGFGFTDELEFIFGTDNATRKYANLQRHEQIAFVVGAGTEKITVQYEGIAEELSGAELEQYLELYYTKNPAARRFGRQSSERSFKVKPIWLRYSNYNSPRQIFELSFKD